MERVLVSFEGGQYRPLGCLGILDRRIVPHPTEEMQRRIRPFRRKTQGHIGHRDGILITPKDGQRSGMLLNRSGPPVLVFQALFHISDEPRQPVVSFRPYHAICDGPQQRVDVRIG